MKYPYICDITLKRLTMKRLRLGLWACFCFCAATTLMGQNKVKTTTEKVMLFIDGAQVTRTKQVDIPAGNSTLIFTGLSPYMDAQSMQVSAKGKLTVTAVNRQYNYRDSLDVSEKQQSLQKELKKIEKQQKEQNAELGLINAEYEMLKTNCSVSNKNTATSLATIKEVNQYYSGQLKTLKTKELAINEQIAELAIKQGQLSSELAQLSGKSLTPMSEIMVNVNAPAACKATFTLNYYVKNAGWFPSYDVRSGSLAEPISIIYKANIFQNTKEEWKNVELSLSSSTPPTGSVAPTLSTYWLDYGLAAPRYNLNLNGNTVSGIVLDNERTPIIGATVTIPGTTIGAITDINGKYSITIPNGQNKLQFSYIGLQTQTRDIQGNIMNVTLQEDTQALDEVVVIGYGTVKKRDLTGAVASMKNEDVTVAPTSNVMEALQGKIAGMDIVKSSGQVGEDVSILLRGSRSIYGSNEPLFIIDGIPGSYSQVNPSDIESVDVLKDASSTAIYGSAGANGVVIITTKRGKEGKATVNFDAYYGFSGSPNYKHGMVGDEWVNYQREAYKYKNGDYPSDMSALFGNQDYTDAYNAGKWIDWIDEASGNTATTQKYSLSVSGGSEKTKIFASTSYNREEGLLSNDNLNKYSLRLNIDQEIFSWAKMGFTSNLTYQDRNQGVKNTFTKGLSSFPLGDAYDQNGKINHEYITGQYSPLGDFIEDQYVNNTRSTYLNVSGYLELSPIKDFTFTSRINGTLSDSRQGQYWGDQCNANRPSYAGSPHAAITNKNAWNYTWENILSYNTTIAKDHNIGGSVITSWNKNQNDSSLAAASGQMVDRWSFWRLASGASQHVESDFAQTQKMSFAVRFNYSYKGKYLFTFSNRWDGVSQFSAGHKWDSFPAGAIAWRISDEPFMNVAKNWLNNLKLRVGYGITGNSGGVDAYGTTHKPMFIPVMD